MTGTVKIVEMTINGHPYTCPECGSRAFTLDANPMSDRFPVDANCDSSHHWDDALITGETIAMILGSRTGRRKARDEDTFSVTVGGALLEGTLQPEVTVDDLRQGWRVLWRRGLKPTLRKKKRAAVRAAKRPVKKAAARVEAAALAAAWTAQAGGYEPDPDYEPEPVIPCGACDGAKVFEIDSKVHEITTIRCSVCRGSGEAM